MNTTTALSTRNTPAARYMRSQIDLWIAKIQSYQRKLVQVKGNQRQAFFDEMVRLRAKIAQMSDQLHQEVEK